MLAVLAGTIATPICATFSATPAMAATAPAPKESVAVFEGQLHSHQVDEVTLHSKAHSLHISLTDGRKAVVEFPSGQQGRLIGEVGASGLSLKIAKVKAPSHTRRYIAVGIAIVLIALVVGGMLMLRRRRRMREDELGPCATTDTLMMTRRSRST